MSVYQIGAGGVFYEIYQEYKTFDGLVELSHNFEIIALDVGGKKEIIYEWNSSVGIHSIHCNSIPNPLYKMSIKFKEKFRLKAYRIAFLPRIRIPTKWELKTSVNGATPVVAHENTEIACPLNGVDCASFSEKLFILSKIRLCNQIDFVVTGVDTKGTYTFAFAAIEFYKSSNNCVNEVNRASIILIPTLYLYIFIL